MFSNFMKNSHEQSIGIVFKILTYHSGFFLSSAGKAREVAIEIKQECSYRCHLFILNTFDHRYE